MIDYLILLLTAIYFVAALLQYFVAPKIGPNPYLGFKIGYTFADRVVWNKTNRLMGKFMMIHALIMFPLCLIPNFLGYFLLIYVIPLLVFIPIGIKYASTLLEMKGARAERASEKKLEPITVSIVWWSTPLVLFAILLILELATYSQLPEVVAVHFDAAGKPNGWSNRGDFILSFSLLSLMFVAISFIFVYLGKHHPLFLHPGKMRFSRDTYLKLIILSMDTALALMFIVYLSIYYFAVHNAAFPVSWILTSAVFVVIIPILYLVYKWRR